MSNASDLGDFAKRYSAAWCSQHAASVAAFFAANGSLRINNGAPAVGRDAIEEVAQSFMTAFPDLRVVMDDLNIYDDHAVYHWTLTGNSTGPGGSGAPVRISGSEVWQINADGLIALSQGSYDSAEYKRQLDQPMHERRQ
jgi:hypothetical protein